MIAPDHQRAAAMLFALGLLLGSSGWAIEPPLDGTPVRGLWWNPAEPGSGIDLHRSPGSNAYTFIWYTFDESGAPVWYLGSGRLSEHQLEAELLHFTWDATTQTASATVVGNVSWNFTGTLAADYQWTIDQASGSEPLEPFVFALGVPSQTRSGLWYHRQQPGWGLTLANQGKVQVAIGYFYDQAGQPTWELGQTALGTEAATIQLDRFTGACPSCSHFSPTAEPGDQLVLDAAELTWTGRWPQSGVAIERLTEPLYRDDAGGPDHVSADQPSAVVDVSLLPMTGATATANQSVFIRDGLIETIWTTDRIDLPQGTTLVRAHGAWLVPGLIDSHVHFVFGPDAANDLFVMLAHGVTTMRQMWGQTGVLDWRDRLRRGEVTGPRLFSASPGIEQPPGFWPQTILVNDTGQARQAVAQQVTAGFDFIKVYSNLNASIYQALADEARRQDIRMVGHVSGGVGIRSALREGQWTVEHLAGYAAEATSSGSSSWSASLSPSRTAQIAQLTAQTGSWNCPTQVVVDRSRADIDRVRASRTWRLLSPAYRGWFDDPQTQPGGGPSSTFLNNRLTMIKALHDAGAGLLVGTDTGVQYVLPGASLFEEIDFFSAAGLSNLEVLKAATVNPAAMLAQQGKLGVIAPGAHADLLLLPGNPVDDLGLLAQKTGLFSRGEYWSAAELERRLLLIEQSYQ